MMYCPSFSNPFLTFPKPVLSYSIFFSRFLAGTDHPFFPPAAKDAGGDINTAVWSSCVANYKLIAALDPVMQTAILQGNAKRVLNL
jgi:hypothetical protein